jgi:hypothetical protein
VSFADLDLLCEFGLTRFTPVELPDAKKNGIEVQYSLPSPREDRVLLHEIEKEMKRKPVPYEVVQVKADDEKEISQLIVNDYEFVDRVNGHRLYRKRVEPTRGTS